MPDPTRGSHVPADRLNLGDGTKANVKTSTTIEAFSTRQGTGSSRPRAQLRVEEDESGTIAGRPKDEWVFQDGTDTNVKTSTATEAFAKRWTVEPPRPPAQEDVAGARSQDASIYVSRPKDEWRLEDASAPAPRVTTSDETYRRSERPSRPSAAAPAPTYGIFDESWTVTPATARPGGGGEAVSHRSIAVQPRPPPARYPALATAPIEVRGRPSDDLKIHDVSAPSYKPARERERERERPRFENPIPGGWGPTAA